MAEFYRIQLGDIYLTKTGLEDGLECHLSIDNLEDLQVAWMGASYPSASGKRIAQPVAAGDVDFAIKIDRLMADVYENLRNAANANVELQAAEPQNASFTVIGVGDSGDFEVEAVWNPNKPFACSGFLEERIENVVLRFITKT